VVAQSTGFEIEADQLECAQILGFHSVDGFAAGFGFFE
jgi:hypothetical protein